MKREFSLLNFTESDESDNKIRIPLTFDEIKEIIEKDDRTTLQEVMKKGLLPDINMNGECLIYPHKEHRRKYSATLLGLAFIRGSIECVKMLLDYGADINCSIVACYASVLECASHSSSVDLVKLLIERGITFDDRDISNSFELVYLARNNDDECNQITILLLPYINNVNYVGKNESTFLHRICSKGNISFARTLLERGADRDAVDDLGNDALYYASECGHLAIVRLLLDWDKSRPVSLDRLNHSLTYAAVWSGQLEAARILTECGANAHTAALLGSVTGDYFTVYLSAPMATFLLDHGADVRAIDGEGCSVLYRVLFRHQGNPNYLALAKLLLERGADADEVISESGATLLLHACRHNAELVVSLLQHGADANLANAITGETPLIRAALDGRISTVKLLLEHGADVNQTNCAGHSVLDLLAAKGKGWEFTEIAQLCMEHADKKLTLK